MPFPQDINWLVLIPAPAVSLLIEEMTFRVLIQDRLGPFSGSAGAILIVSILFAVAHFSPGAPGSLYARSKI